MLSNYTLNALVVDDMTSMRRMLKTYLAHLGLTRVTEASSVATALDTIRVAEQAGTPYNLVLLDYYLGDATDGQQLLEIVRAENLLASSAVIIMVTAERDYASVAKVAEHSPDAYIIKPFTAAGLEDRLRPVLERKHGIRRYNASTQGLKPVYDLFDAGMYSRVVAFCDAMHAKEGTKQDLAQLKGDSLLRMGDLSAARVHYAQFPEFAWAVLNVAHIDAKLHNHSQAIAALEKLCADSPLYAQAFDSLAGVHLDKGNPAAAMDALASHCAKSPTVPRMRLMAKAATLLAKHDVAEELLAKVVRDNIHAHNKNLNDYAWLVRAMLKQNKLTEAVSTQAQLQRDVPGVSGHAGTEAVRVSIRMAQCDIDEAALGDTVAVIKDKRLGLITEKRDNAKAIALQLAAEATDPEACLYVAEALAATGSMELAGQKGAYAVVHGAQMPPDLGTEELREAVVAATDAALKTSIKTGLAYLRAGNEQKAVDLFEVLAMAGTGSTQPVALANFIAAVVAQVKATGIKTKVPLARVALEQLKSVAPSYERLPILDSAIQALLKGQ